MFENDAPSITLTKHVKREKNTHVWKLAGEFYNTSECRWVPEGEEKLLKILPLSFFFYLRQLFQVMLGCCRGCDNCGAPPQKAWQDGALQRIQEGSFNTMAQLASITHCRFNN